MINNLIPIFLVLVYFLTSNKYSFCQKGLIFSILRPFVHGNLIHLFSNIISFYQITQFYLDYTVILTILFFEIIFDYLLTKYYSITCSIGFSGVIFGLLTYLLLNSEIPIGSIVTILAIQFAPGLFQNNISNLGHFIGIISGFLSFLLHKTLI